MFLSSYENNMPKISHYNTFHFLRWHILKHGNIPKRAKTTEEHQLLLRNHPNPSAIFKIQLKQPKIFPRTLPVSFHFYENWNCNQLNDANFMALLEFETSDFLPPTRLDLHPKIKCTSIFMKIDSVNN